ncbi:MAG: nodulation protein NfeD [Methanobacteriota archaeon]|jgi:membrane-bound serine protease (ClpP class)
MKKIYILILFLISLSCVYAAEEQVYVLKVEGVIDPIVSDYIRRGISAAEKENAVLIIQLDTPGGLDTSMRSIIQDILNSEIPVVVYVHPKGARAASAGSFILVASHVAAMTPGTNVGAAHPVAMMGNTSVSEKIVNDAVAYIKSVAELKKRNISLAASFVYNSTSITATEALNFGIADVVAENYDSLLSQLDGRKIEVKSGERILRTKNAAMAELPMSAREEFLHIISNPNIAYLLFLAGIYGIIFELSNPGAILPGVIGGICILLALWSFQALSVSAAGLALIIFAIVLFIAEVMAPTHGILVAGGIIALFLGSIMLVKEPFIRISLGVIAPATIFTALFFAFAIGMAIKAHRRRPATGIEGMIGLVGVAREELSPEGSIFIRGELWRARAKGEAIQKDKKIKVVDADNLVLIVEEVK